MTTTDLRALLGDRYDDVMERALVGADTPHNGYQVMRGYVDERDVVAVLAAVLPDLLAESWDEGYEEASDLCHDNEYGMPRRPTPNPYRTDERNER